MEEQQQQRKKGSVVVTVNKAAEERGGGTSGQAGGDGGSEDKGGGGGGGIYASGKPADLADRLSASASLPLRRTSDPPPFALSELMPAVSEVEERQRTHSASHDPVKRERRKSWRMDLAGLTHKRKSVTVEPAPVEGFATLRDVTCPVQPIPKVMQHSIVLCNNMVEVKKAVKRRASLYLQDCYDQNMLHVACYEGHLDMVAYLLTKYKEDDLSLRDKNGWTPLHCAASRCHYEICELLLKKGASPNSQNGTLTSPFAYAVRNEFNTRLEEILSLMLRKGADIEMRNRWGETPLHNTCKRGNLESSIYLVDNGADINAVDTFGETALHKAARFGSVPLVQALIEKGANPNVSGYCGTPLTVAMAHRHLPVIEVLREERRSRGKVKASKQVYASKPYDGPSIDNLDIAALLSIHGDDGGASGPLKIDKLEDFDIVENNDDFYFEVGRNELFQREEHAPESELVDLRIEDDKYVFDYGDPSQVEKNVLNIIGLAKVPPRDEPLVISVVSIAEKAKFRGIIRTKTGDHKFHIPAALAKKKRISAKKVIKLLKASLPLKLWHVSDPKLTRELMRHEELKKREVRCYKIGVLYAKDNQKTEEEILGNQETSEEFDRFLRLLGDKIELAGWQGYRGDLDVKENKNGEHSVYTKLGDIEVMFHVAPYLPYDPIDPQQIPRKKFIGNDLVTIVFQDGGAFTPPCVSGDFLHVFAVVQPYTSLEIEGGYQLAVCSRKGVPQFGPPIPNPPYFKSDEYFRDFLLTKLLNGERAALHSPFIANKMKNSRQMQLDYFIKEFLPNGGAD